MRATLILTLLIALTGCASEERIPPATPEEAEATEIVNEYIFNTGRAKEKYEGQWFTIRAGPILRVKDDRGVIAKHRGITMNMMFRGREETWLIDRDEHITAVCRIGHLIAGELLMMKDCRWPDAPEPELTTEKPSKHTGTGYSGSPATTAPATTTASPVTDDFQTAP